MKWFLCALVVLSLSVNAWAEKSNNPIICKGKYVLCTAAPCKPIPGMHDMALCQCQVKTGYSFGFLSCDARKPKESINGTQLISTYISTFSTSNEARKPIMTCPGGSPWTNCLDMPCLQDKNNPDKAVCTCEIKRNTGPYVTEGANCSVEQCKTTMWSGATPEQLKIGMDSLSKGVRALGGTQQVRMTYCPKK